MDPSLRSNPLVFVSDLSAPQLTPDDRAHLTRSLRLRSGDRFVVADGDGHWQQAVMGDAIETIGPVHFEERPKPRLTIGFSLVKGERADLVVQKLTELGIDRITPIVTDRCVVRWDESKVEKNLKRHRRIVREAAMQSRNLWPPTVHRATSFDDFVDSFSGYEPGVELVLAEPGDEVLSPSTAALAIGPEGGFSPAELKNKKTAGLPGRILRSETAAITAAVLLASRRLDR